MSSVKGSAISIESSEREQMAQANDVCCRAHRIEQLTDEIARLSSVQLEVEQLQQVGDDGKIRR